MAVPSDGRVVLVTGAGSGIGRVIAQRFAGAGSRVMVTDRDSDAAVRVAREIEAADRPEVASHPMDVTDPQAVRVAVAAALDRFGCIDIVVNNAGVACDTPFDALSPEEWDRDLDVVLKGPFLVSQAVLPDMVRRRHGTIVNIGSVNAAHYVGNEAYSAAKAGLESLTRSLAARYGPYGIRVNLIAPGTIRTPVWDARLSKEPEVLERLVKWYPLGRVGTPDDVAAAAMFLASDLASWITGVTLPVDGGLLAGNIPMVRDMIGDTYLTPPDAT